MSARVIVTVRGGAVHGVYSSNKNISVDVIDYDIYKEEMSDDDLELRNKLEEEVKALHSLNY
jgi:hypothetical protein